MEVLCVNHELFDPEERPYGPHDPQIGSPYKVENSFTINTRKGDMIYYELVGFDYSIYNQKNFSPLNSNLDETTLVTEEFEEKYYVPVNQSVCK
jgi:hypothetical protein